MKHSDQTQNQLNMRSAIVRSTKTLLLFLVCCITTQAVLGQQPRQTLTVANVDGAALTTGTTWTWNNAEATVVPAFGATNQVSKLQLELILNTGSDHDQGDAIFDATCVLQVKGTDPNGSVLFQNNVQLDIAGTTTGLTPEYVQVKDLTPLFYDIDDLEISVISFSYSGSIQDAQVHLSARLHEERRIKADLIASHAIQLNTPVLVSGSNQIHFSWEHAQLPDVQIRYPEYELQMLRLYNTDPAAPVTAANDVAIDWSEAVSTRIISNEEYPRGIDLTLANGSGFYIYRIRPISNWYHGGAGNALNWGEWSVASHAPNTVVDLLQGTQTSSNAINIGSATYAVQSAGNDVLYYELFDRDRIWSYGRSYSEGNLDQEAQTRIGESISYSNSLNQVQQSQAHRSEGNIIHAGATVYDLSGRPAVNSMAVPLEGQSSLSYLPGLLSNDNGDPYSWLDFELTLTTDNVDPNGPFQYYSDLNPDLDTPSAEGYPFSRTVFKPDGTNSVRQVSAPGEEFSFASGSPDSRSPISLTGAVLRSELEYMFGSETMEGNAMMKQIVVDGNGQASTSYVDKEGRVIATSLGQNDNPNLEDLSSEQNATVTIDEPIDEVISDGPYANIKQITIPFERNTQITVDYQITPQNYQDECLGLDLCLNCDYVIQFFIYENSCPSTLLYDETKEPFDLSDLALLDCSNTPSLYSWQYTFPLPGPGEFTVGRRLSVNNNVGPNAILALDHAEQTALSEYNAALDLVFDPMLNLFNGTSFNPAVDLPDWYTNTMLVDINNDTEFEVDVPNGNVDPSCLAATLPVLTCEPCVITGQEMWDHAVNDPDGLGINFSTALLGYPESGETTAAFTQATFLDLINNMLAYQVGGENVYDCGVVWNCWLNALDLEANRASLSLDVSLINPPPPAAAGTTVDLPSLMYNFLSCAGFVHIQSSTVPGQGSGTGYLTTAFNTIYCDAGSNCLSSIVDLYSSSYPPPGGGNNVVFSDCASLSQVVDLGNGWEVSGYDLIQQCYVTGPPTQITATEMEDYLLDVLYEAETACIYQCQGLIPQFEADVIALHNLDPIIDVGEIDCFVYSLVNQCMKDCGDLVVEYDGNSVATGLGPQSALDRIANIMGGQFELADPALTGGTCPSGFEPVTLQDPTLNPDPTTLPDDAAVADLLNDILDDFGTWALTNSTTFGWYESTPGSCKLSYSNWPFINCTAEFDVQLRSQIGGGTGTCNAGSSALIPLSCFQSYPAESSVYWVKVNIGGTSVFNMTLGDAHGFSCGAGNNTGQYMADAITNNRKPFTDALGRFVVLAGGLDFQDISYTLSPFTLVGPDPFDLGGSGNCPYGGLSTGSIILAGNTTHSIQNPVTLTTLFDANNSTFNCIEPIPCSPDDVCIRWYSNGLGIIPVGGPNDDLPPLQSMDYASCDELNLQLLIDAIHAERARIRNEAVLRFLQGYQSRCTDPGQVNDVMSISYSKAEHHFTLYHYDRAGNLMRTTPPRDVPGGLDIVSDADHMVDGSTRYHYNSRGQLIWQETPDAGHVQYFYDLEGRLRISQSQVQDPTQSITTDILDPNGEKMSYTIYDGLGRIIEVGESSLQSDIAEIYTQGDDLPQFLSDNPTWPAAGAFRTLSIYSIPYTDANGTAATYLNGSPQRFLNNRISHVISDADGDLNSIYDQVLTVYSYDVHGNVEWMFEEVDGIGRNYVRSDYQLLSGRVQQVYFNEGRVDQFMHKYRYDGDGRLIEVETSIDGLIWDSDARYSFYDHGPLKRVVIGEDMVQGVDHTYTIHGWLKRINDHALDYRDAGMDGAAGTNERVGKDAFGMMLAYYNGDFVHNDLTASTTWTETNDYYTADRDLYNGNISAWASRSLIVAGEVQSEYDAYSGVNGFQFQYDALNRLVGTNWQTHNGSNWSDDAQDQFEASYEYDPNGNLDALSRNAYWTGSSALMDEFAYNIDPLRNQLDDITETASQNFVSDIQHDHSYTYDRNGSLESEMWNGKQMDIEWNPYRKVLKVDLEDGTNLEFLYDAMGRRVAKKHIDPSDPNTGNGNSDVYTYYLVDAAGNHMAIYERKFLPITLPYPGYTDIVRLVEHPIYGAGRIGTHKGDQLVVSETHHYIGQTEPIVIAQALNTKAELERMEVVVFTPAGGSLALGKYWPNYLSGYSMDPNDATPSSSISANGVIVYGKQTRNIHVAEDTEGQTLFRVYTHVSNNSPDVCWVGDASGGLMWDNTGSTAGLKSGNTKGTISAQVPGRPHQYFVVTISDNEKPYVHLIDMSFNLYSQGAVIGKNYPLYDANDQHAYGVGIAAIDDRTSYGQGMLYLRRHKNSTADIVGIKLSEQLADDILSTTPFDPAVHALQLTSFPSKDVNGLGEMQVSPSAQYLAVSNDSEGYLGWFAQRGEVRLYEISAERDQLNYLDRFEETNTRIRSIDFTENSKYVYFVQNGFTVNKGGGGSLNRVQVANLGIKETVLNSVSDVRRNKHGHMSYTQIMGPAASQQFVGSISDPENAVAASVTSHWITPTALTGMSPKLMGHLSYQAHIISNEFYSANRSVGFKRYQFTDHLGNVRAVVSDLKLCTLDAFYEPSDFEPEMVMRADYYAYGMAMPKRHANLSEYRYGFNGMEGDPEMKGEGNSYTTMYRQYDPRIGRWTAIDPVVHPWQSPYNAFDSNPIYWSDPSGADSENGKGDGGGPDDPNTPPKNPCDGDTWMHPASGTEYIAKGGKWLLVQNECNTSTCETEQSEPAEERKDLCGGNSPACGSTESDRGFIDVPTYIPVNPVNPSSTAAPKLGPKIAQSAPKPGATTGTGWGLRMLRTGGALILHGIFYTPDVNPHSPGNWEEAKNPEYVREWAADPANRGKTMNRVRAQIQFFSKHGTHDELVPSSTAYNTPEIGVLVVQGEVLILELEQKMRKLHPKIMWNQNVQAVFGRAYARMGELPAQGGIIPGTVTTLSYSFTHKGQHYTIEIESLNGHNLRQ